MKNVQEENIEAEKQRDFVKKDEEITSLNAQEAAEIQAQCKQELSTAEPKLEEALKALKTLKQNDFVQLKSYQKPP